MEAAALAQTGVLRRGEALGAGRVAFRAARRADFNLLRVVHAKGQLVAVNPKFNRVAHRRELDERDLCAGDDAHIQKMLAQRALAANGRHRCRFADRQVFQCHALAPFLSRLDVLSLLCCSEFVKSISTQKHAYICV